MIIWANGIHAGWKEEKCSTENGMHMKSKVDVCNQNGTAAAFPPNQKRQNPTTR